MMSPKACTGRLWQAAWCFRRWTGDAELIFLALDSCCADDGEVAAIRAAILERFALKPEQLMFHPSHSHSLPVLTRRTADRTGGALLTAYLDSLAPICIGLIEQARASAGRRHCELGLWPLRPRLQPRCG